MMKITCFYDCFLHKKAQPPKGKVDITFYYLLFNSFSIISYVSLYSLLSLFEYVLNKLIV